jgi:hypothetical protein
MRICSKFVDYYDNCAAFGIDESIQYHRINRKISIQNPDSADASLVSEIQKLIKTINNQLPSPPNPYGLIYIGFCGKVYVGLRETKDLISIITGQTKSSCTNDIQCHWNEHGFSSEDLDRGRSSYRSRYRSKSSKKPFSLREWFSKTSRLWPVDAPAIFCDRKLVSFCYYHGHLELNPHLKTYNFQKVHGGVEAFQEIQMFISGVLGAPERPMIELTDQDRIAAHGFDSMSFRKIPTTKSR